MDESPTNLDLVTLGIALWGAILSTILAIRNFRKDKRQVKVRCRIVERTISSDGQFTNLILGVTAVNIGHRDVTLEYVGLKSTSKEYFVLETQLLPKTLKDGESVTIRMNLDDAESWLRSISASEKITFAYVMDTERTQYQTSVFPVEMFERKMVKTRWFKT